MLPSPQTIARFWSHVDRQTDDGCWPWTAGLDNHGYGHFAYRVDGRNKDWKASRFAWFITNGETDLCVLHRCDNPKCVNPQHLFIGTRADNARDCKLKGRTQRWCAALTHCKRGHEFTEANTRVARGVRHCRACGAGAKRARAEILASAGACVRCGNESVTYRCAKCADVHNAASRARRKRTIRRDAGVPYTVSEYRFIPEGQ